MSDREVELLAIGAGPSNLALAVALEELAPDLADNSLMIERRPAVEWQPGLLLPWAKSQVSFLKDLVTLRNPSSEFSFLNYLYTVGRLDDFINMGSFIPYRLEISEYISWVANSLSRVQIQLNCSCTAIEPRRGPDGAVTGWFTQLDDGSVISSRYLVIGMGRDAYTPPVFDAVPPNRLVHSTRYRPAVAGLDKDFPYRLGVVGSAQSAAEMYRALQDDLPGAQITWVMRAIGIGGYDKTKFINELYYPSFVDDFYQAKPAARAQLLREMHRTNYAGVEPPFIDELYSDGYLDRLNKQQRKRIVTMTDITAAEANDDEVTIEMTSRMTGEVSELRCDRVFLGTGFVREMPTLIRRLGQALELDTITVDRRYRLNMDTPSTAACYLQGVNEATHGIGDSLLSVLASRAGDIVADLTGHRDQAPNRGADLGADRGADRAADRGQARAAAGAQPAGQAPKTGLP